MNKEKINDSILDIIKEESDKADVRKYTCINNFGYSQFERDIANRICDELILPYSPDIARKLLVIRDLLLAPTNKLTDENNDELIYHILYSIASPEFNKAGNAWNEMERIAAITNK
jgi:hypothetical protein